MAEPAAPAFYARQGTAVSDWWTLLHPPYTIWHLSYVVLGAAIAPSRDWTALAFSVLAFFLAVGLAAHALDELHGRPLRTNIPSSTLWAVVPRWIHTWRFDPCSAIGQGALKRNCR